MEWNINGGLVFTLEPGIDKISFLHGADFGKRHQVGIMAPGECVNVNLTVLCCGTTWNGPMWFLPVEDTLCNCGKNYLIKWLECEKPSPRQDGIKPKTKVRPPKNTGGTSTTSFPSSM